MSRMQQIAVIIAVTTLIFFNNLGGPKLWDRDEPRNARCAVEMLEANDWVTPTFNGELRDHKPAMVYWGMMLSYSLFGVSEFSARFCSALYGLGTVLLTYFIGTRLFRRQVGFWAAIVLASTIMFSVAARAATPDAPLIFFATLAIAIYVWGSTTNSETERSFVSLYPRKWRVVALMFATMGIAVLSKGPVGLVLPTAVIGMFLLIERLPSIDIQMKNSSWRTHLFNLSRTFAPIHFLKTCWTMRPLTALFVSGVVAVPWFVWVHLRTDGEFTQGFFLTHNVSRAMNTMEGHSGGPWFYPLALLIGFFPWSIFWLPMLIDSIKQMNAKAKWRDGYVFACCWVGVYVVLFSLASTKLPSYITPCYPGVAMLMGIYIDRIVTGELSLTKLWRRLALGSLITVGVIIAIALPVVAHQYFQSEYWLGGLGVILILGGSLAWYQFEMNKKAPAISSLSISAVLFMTFLMGYVTTAISDHRPINEITTFLQQGQGDNQINVASYGAIEPSYVFYANQTVETLKTTKAIVSFLNQPSEHSQVLLTHRRLLPELMNVIPESELELTQLSDFLGIPGLVIVHRSFPKSHYQTITARFEAQLLKNN